MLIIIIKTFLLDNSSYSFTHNKTAITNLYINSYCELLLSYYIAVAIQFHIKGDEYIITYIY